MLKFLVLLFCLASVWGEPTLEDRRYCGAGDTPPPNRVNTTQRVAALRSQMQKYGLQGYIVPDGDAHQTEYVAPHDERRAYLTGFTGSEGVAVVLEQEQAQWTDGRYFLQADEQLDCDWLLMKEGLPDVPSVVDWIKSRLGAGSKLGADPRLVSADIWLSFQSALVGDSIDIVVEDTNGELIPDLIDDIWDTQPPVGENHTVVLSVEFAGETWQSKVNRVRQVLKDSEIDLLVVAALDEIAWLLNIRGDDIPYFPVFSSYLLLTQDEIKLFTEDVKVSTPDVREHLLIDGCTSASVEVCVQHFLYEAVFDTLTEMSQDSNINKVVIPSTWGYTGGANYALYRAVPQDVRVSKVSPILFFKASKNDVEIKGMKNAHIKDAVAVISFLAQLEAGINSGETWTELSASDLLHDYRLKQNLSRGDSFLSVSAFGSNGAIIHYRPSNATNKEITDQSLYLIDSGGQYDDGTTDITRTLHYGTPTNFQKEMYTRVLIGAMELWTLIFPEGLTDVKSDILARRPIYEVGLDYRHGTGHGIGMFLYVHESPTQVRIYGKEHHPYQVGYFFSDEPGYYKDDDFGIRLETILGVKEVQTPYTFDKKMLGFEPVTLVPFEPKLIDSNLLTRKQCHELNNYHERVRGTVGPLLQTEGYDWMMTKTEPITCY